MKKTLLVDAPAVFTIWDVKTEKPGEQKVLGWTADEVAGHALCVSADGKSASFNSRSSPHHC